MRATVVKFTTSPYLSPHLRKYKTPLSLFFTKRWSVHLAATLSNLDQFENFLQAETKNKIYRLHIHLFTYHVKSLSLMTS